MPSKLSADEIALYDRQIRLWGIDAQTRIRSSKILLINLSSTGVEIVKNLMLSGVGSLTILDDRNLDEEQLDLNFFVNAKQIGQSVLEASFNKIQELNPRVELRIVNQSLAGKLEEKEPGSFFKNFDLIIASETTKKEIITLNKLTRQYKIPFYATGIHGLYGFIFTDLIEYTAEQKIEVASVSSAKKKLGKLDSVHELISSERKKENDQLVDIHKVVNKYKPFSEIGGGGDATGSTTVARLKEFHNTRRKLNKISIVLPCILTLLEHYPYNYETNINSIQIDYAIFEQQLKQTLIDLQLENNLQINELEVGTLLRQAFAQFQPTAAIIGGALAQDVIQFLSGKQCFNNFVILDGIQSKMPIYVL